MSDYSLRIFNCRSNNGIKSVYPFIAYQMCAIKADDMPNPIDRSKGDMTAIVVYANGISRGNRKNAPTAYQSPHNSDRD